MDALKRFRAPRRSQLLCMRCTSQRANTVLYSMSLAEEGFGGPALLLGAAAWSSVSVYCYLFSVSLPDRYLWMTLDSSV